MLHIKGSFALYLKRTFSVLPPRRKILGEIGVPINLCALPPPVHCGQNAASARVACLRNDKWHLATCASIAYVFQYNRSHWDSFAAAARSVRTEKKTNVVLFSGSYQHWSSEVNEVVSP